MSEKRQSVDDSCESSNNKRWKQKKRTGKHEETFTFQAASFREPYCSLLLNGAKTIETRKWPMLAEHHGLLAVHCAYHEWDGAEDVRSFAAEVRFHVPLQVLLSFKPKNHCHHPFFDPSARFPVHPLLLPFCFSADLTQFNTSLLPELASQSLPATMRNDYLPRHLAQQCTDPAR
jgi:hypothetical protein